MRSVERTEFRFSGEGGQGIILAGIILSEAAIIDGLNTIQTQSYGPESRGGASKAEVVIAAGEIDYPKVRQPHYLLALTREAFQSYATDIVPGGAIVADSDAVPPEALDRIGEEIKVYRLPILQAAEEDIGRRIVANIVALGALQTISGVVSREALEEAVLSRVPKGTETLNRRALEAGRMLVSSGGGSSV